MASTPEFYDADLTKRVTIILKRAYSGQLTCNDVRQFKGHPPVPEFEQLAPPEAISALFADLDFHYEITPAPDLQKALAAVSVSRRPPTTAPGSP
jgi:hypothetical protein